MKTLNELSFFFSFSGTLKQNTHTIAQSNYWKLENLSTRKDTYFQQKSQGTLKDKKIKKSEETKHASLPDSDIIYILELLKKELK